MQTVAPKTPIQNRRIAKIRALVSPNRLRDKLPVTEANQRAIVAAREAIASILDGSDTRMLVVVGPCSIHDPVAGLEYARRLAELAVRLEKDLYVVMRAYFEKPRTTVGWKGLINDPELDGTFRVDEGLFTARAFLIETISLGVPVGCEFLDPITAQYLADTVSWGAIGARTVWSQIHRQLASGLSMPVGFKNAPDGDVQAAVDAIAAASHAQVFPGIDDDGRAAVFETTGNADSHLVLRGGSAGPNFDERDVADALHRLECSGLPRRVVIDASHANSAKDHRRQPAVAADIATRLAAGREGVVGLMLESFLVPGRQDLTTAGGAHLVFGQSITDACIGWETTVTVLCQLADAVAQRRVVSRSSA
jgi:3-deoxy-7-phosphoheptulonate synthase